jgi:hypothetical protein
MKVSDVIRELELDKSMSPKTIHILGNMMADVRCVGTSGSLPSGLMSTSLTTVRRLQP